VEETQANTIVDQLHAMRQRMDVLFSESFEAEESGGDVCGANAPEEAWTPLVDVWDSGDEWLLIADLPGVSDHDLQVELVENQLTVRGNRRTTTAHGEMKVARRERLGGAFSRTFELPDHARVEAIKAELKHGVLTVTVPKDPGSRATPQKVQIRTG
jgi:HSP20 family protein